MRAQHLSHPRRAPALFRRAAVITVLHRGQIATIAGKKARALYRGFSVKKHIIHAVAKGILNRAPAAMPRMPNKLVYAIHCAAIIRT